LGNTRKFVFIRWLSTAPNNEWEMTYAFLNEVKVQLLYWQKTS